MKIPKRQTNAARRSREYLRPDEMARLLEAAAKTGRNRHRDRTLLLVMYIHGLRNSELCKLTWMQIDFHERCIHVSRLKGSTDSVHPLTTEETQALLLLRADNPKAKYVFVSERGGKLQPSTVRKLVKSRGELAGLGDIHPHMMRHACGFKLANDGVDTRAIQSYLGHRSIVHTTRYTELAPGRFNGLWD